MYKYYFRKYNYLVLCSRNLFVIFNFNRYMYARVDYTKFEITRNKTWRKAWNEVIYAIT